MKEEQSCQSPGDKGVNRVEESAEWLEHTVPGRAIGDFVFILKKWKGPRCFKHSTDFFFFFQVPCGGWRSDFWRIKGDLGE